MDAGGDSRARAGARGLTVLSAVELTRVRLVVGERTILDETSLAVRDGEFVAVLGPNGAGKTTLMRAILGLIAPVAGRISVLGEPAVRGNPAIGYLPQTRSLVPPHRLSGSSLVASAAQGHRWGLPMTRASTRRDVDWAIERVGAQDLAKRALAELSGGERQRLLLAQALLGRPRLLLLDEPLISLDPHHQRSVVDLVKQIQRELEITVLLSAHELNPLLDVIDRVLYLGNRHAALGTVEEVITGPTLSRLYGSEIEVQRIGGRIFVLSSGLEVDRDEHRHHA
jgi:zinc/manganese transport system ATP-binding protein